MAAKNAILKAKIEGVIYEILVKTDAANVFVEDNVTLAAKLSTILSDVASRATKDEMTTALAGKADKSHKHDQADINGLADLIATLATTTALTEAIDALRQEMLGDTPVEAYNTFTELAAYISEHQEAADALTNAIGTKANQTDFAALKTQVEGLGALAAKDKIGSADLEAELLEKVNASAEGNHAHLNKDVLDGITAQNVTDWNDAVAKEHEHSNKAILDDISSAKVAAWDAAEQNAKTYADGLAKNYDAAGAAATAEGNAKAYAKEYADGLAGNYDAKGAAAQALTDAKAYTDGKDAAMDTRVKAVEGTSHTHANKDVIDGITAANVTAWNGKARVIYSASEPADLTANDLWVQLV